MGSLTYFDRAHFIAKNTKQTRVIRFFPDSDLRCMHLGLSAAAKKQGVDVTSLSPGEFVVFANKKQTGLKIFAPGNVIAYLKSPDNRRLELRVIQMIPRYFNGTKFNYDGALKEFFETKKAA